MGTPSGRPRWLIRTTDLASLSKQNLMLGMAALILYPKRDSRQSKVSSRKQWDLFNSWPYKIESPFSFPNSFNSTIGNSMRGPQVHVQGKKLITMLTVHLGLYNLSMFCPPVQKRVTIAGLKLLSLEGSACKVGPWLVSGNLTFRVVPQFPDKSYSLFLDCINKVIYVNTCFPLRVWNFGNC